MQAQSEMVGKVAPGFVRSDLNRREIDLRKYRGKVVLLNFWAAWCAPCQVELPEFETWEKKFGADGLKVIAISMDDGDSPVRRTVRRLHLDLTVVMGDAELGEEYGGVLGLPVTFLIDREGKIVARFKGESDLGEMESRLKQLLAE
jgi:peroxiredoxin